ncbi:hypothetical protein [Streptomyces angustmyceticus]|uniref:hypothetical protein n=1 Tax=Streptomyces angustmyceticus TaxID=285578 RepID=UPI0036F1A9C4
MLRASDVGAPHRRERTFLAAWPAEHPAQDADQQPREERRLTAPDKRKSGGHGPNLADEVEWPLLPTPQASDGIKGSPNQRHGNGDLTLPSAAAALRASDTGAPGRRPGKGWRPPLPTVVLPLWADSAPGAEQTDGEHTQPPSPDGRPSPVPRPSPPTRAAGSVPTSSSGCRASMTAGSPPPPGSDDRRSSPRSATALFPNMRHEHCSCGHRPSRGARAARPCSAPLSDFYGRAKPRNLRIL